MKQLYYRTLSFFNVVESNIAFYPTVLALCGFFFAVFMIYMEDLGVSKYLVEHLPILVVDNGDTAMTILSALISGLISVVVFSFSMVMLLLSQASSNYSPRLLPGLISDKRHQIILGIYLATILYNIFILFSIQPTGDKYQIPGFSVLIGILATVVCLYAFIYFIHNISQSIQISNILQGIFRTAKNRLDQLIEEETDSPLEFPDTSEWHEYYTTQSGYLQNISDTNLINICIDEETKLHILPVKGIFVLQGIPLFRSEKKLEEDTVKKVISNFNFARPELVADNYVLAFKQITEIIVKAMSPGINDPGTAINGIDYLTELFALRMQKKDHVIVKKDDTSYIKLNSVSFQELLYNVMASIRAYCKHDIILIKKLLLMFNYLKRQNTDCDDYKKHIEEEVHVLLNDARDGISNEIDWAQALKMAQNLSFNIEKFN